MKKLSHILVSLLLAIVLVCYSICVNFIKPSIQTGANSYGIKLPIIMYHLVLEDESKKSKFVISPSQFKEDMEYLLDNGYTPIVFEDLYNYIDTDISLPQNPIMITFDDGYYNNYLYVYPYLKEKNIKIVLSIIGKYAQKYSDINDVNAYYSHCNWNVLKEMSLSNLVEIQNHSYNLHSYTKSRKGAARAEGESVGNYKKMLYSDLIDNHRAIEKNVGKTPSVFAFPFGAMSIEAHDIIKDIGYRASLTCSEGINYITKDKECLFKLKRYNRPSEVSTKDFFYNILN